MHHVGDHRHLESEQRYFVPKAERDDIIDALVYAWRELHRRQKVLTAEGIRVL